MARRFHGVFIVFLLKLALGECEESSEEAAPYEVLGDEYEQIYQGIPALFEYIIEILEERPQILEKDDAAFFQEPLQEACEGNERRKRGTFDQCKNDLASAEDIEALRRNFVTNKLGDVKHTHTDSDHATDEIVTEIADVKTSESQNNIHKLKPKLNIKTKTNKMGSKYKTNGKKRYVNIDESFLGSIDWNKLSISPEEVEEQALKVEQAIEDHNKKKER